MSKCSPDLNSDPDLRFELIRSKRKTIALIINSEAKLIVRAPLRAPDKLISSLVNEKQKWIKKKKAEQKFRQSHIFIPKFVDGELFLFKGSIFKLVTDDHFNSFSRSKDHIRIDDESQTIIVSKEFHSSPRENMVAWYQKEARKLIPLRVKHFSLIAGSDFSRIRITNARKRWGSCNINGTLCFSWRLIMAPQDVIDYVVVHELMHLKVMDHSKSYWNNVEKNYPDHARCRKWLKDNGHRLIF